MTVAGLSHSVAAADPSPNICAPGTEPHVCEMLKALHDAEIDKFNALGDKDILIQQKGQRDAWWHAYVASLPPGPELAEHIAAACKPHPLTVKPLAALCTWWRDLHTAKPLPPPRNVTP